MPRKSLSTAKANAKSAGARRAVSAPKTAAKAAPKPLPKIVKKAAREQIVPVDELSGWVEAILPQAAIVRKPSGAMYQAGTKIFAFTRPDGVAMKLPAERVRTLVESRDDASFLVMGTKTMREWLMLCYSSPGDYRKDAKLFAEAMRFVESLEK